MAGDRPRPGIRLTDAEREAAADRLIEAHGEGRLTLDELDERLAAAYRALVAGDLEPLFTDVPTDHERRLLSDRHVTVTLRAGPGGLVRDGRWVVPRRLAVEQHVGGPSGLGLDEITLDFRFAVVRHPRVDLDIRTSGPVQLVLPPRGTADLTALRGPGRPAGTTVPTRQEAGRVHLVVRGRVVRRRAVRVTYRRRPRWWSALTM